MDRDPGALIQATGNQPKESLLSEVAGSRRDGRAMKSTLLEAFSQGISGGNGWQSRLGVKGEHVRTVYRKGTSRNFLREV